MGLVANYECKSPYNKRNRWFFSIVVSILLIFQGAFVPIGNAAEQPGEQPVDIFIGDSSATNAVSGMTQQQRWTKLFADADGARELSVAVSGTGYLVGGSNTYDKQLAKVLQLMKDRHISADRVRRVFVVGGGNDFPQVTLGRGILFSIAACHLAARVEKEFPHAQKLYIPEMSPATDKMLGAYRKAEPFLPWFFFIASSHGFQFDRNWYQWVTDPEKNGYVIADKTHLTAKGHNETAHRIVGWVNALDGPKVEGAVPEWGGDTDTVLRFDANGGIGTTQSLKGAAGADMAIPAGNMTNNGRTLESWNTAADGSGRTYQVGSEITLPSASLVLYAQWGDEPKSHERTALSGLNRFAVAISGASFMMATILVLIRRKGGFRLRMDDETSEFLENWQTRKRSRKGGGNASS